LRKAENDVMVALKVPSINNS